LDPQGLGRRNLFYRAFADQPKPFCHLFGGRRCRQYRRGAKRAISTNVNVRYIISDSRSERRLALILLLVNSRSVPGRVAPECKPAGRPPIKVRPWQSAKRPRVNPKPDASNKRYPAMAVFHCREKRCTAGRRRTIRLLSHRWQVTAVSFWGAREQLVETAHERAPHCDRRHGSKRRRSSCSSLHLRQKASDSRRRPSPYLILLSHKIRHHVFI
jgi:hypothetical protein